MTSRTCSRAARLRSPMAMFSQMTSSIFTSIALRIPKATRLRSLLATKLRSCRGIARHASLTFKEVCRSYRELQGDEGLEALAVDGASLMANVQKTKLMKNYLCTRQTVMSVSLLSYNGDTPKVGNCFVKLTRQTSKRRRELHVP